MVAAALQCLDLRHVGLQCLLLLSRSSPAACIIKRPAPSWHLSDVFELLEPPQMAPCWKLEDCLPAATDFAICANVKSMNRFACSTRVASRPPKGCRPRTSFSARKSFGPLVCPGIAISRALLNVEQSTAQMAASSEFSRMARFCWTSSFDRSRFAFSSQSIGSTRHPHQANAYATGAFSPENTSRAQGGLSPTWSLQVCCGGLSPPGSLQVCCGGLSPPGSLQVCSSGLPSPGSLQASSGGIFPLPAAGSARTGASHLWFTAAWRPPHASPLSLTALHW